MKPGALVLFLLAQAHARAAPPAASTQLQRADVTRTLATLRKVVSPHGEERSLAIPVNGTQQWISVRGHDLRNPILLFLHGGPGSPTQPAAWTFQTPWEDYFTVVQWDQRGTGKTYAANDASSLGKTMTVEQLVDDTVEVIRYLRERYGKQKIFLLGHSWGTVLGVQVALRHPEWLYAYVSVGQLLDLERNEEEGYAWALERAKAEPNAEAVKELEALAPYPGGKLDFERIGVQRKWLMHYGGLTWGRPDFRWEADAWDLSPDYSERELKAIDAGGRFTLDHLLQPLEALKLETHTKFKCPVFLFEGRHDYATSHTLAAIWFQQLSAPQKKMIWFEDSAHMVMQEQPGRFLHHLVTDVRPVAVRAHDAAPEEVVQ